MKKNFRILLSTVIICGLTLVSLPALADRNPGQSLMGEPKPTESAYWAAIRPHIEMDLDMFRWKYPEINSYNMGQYIFDPYVKQYYDMVMADYHRYLNDPRPTK